MTAPMSTLATGPGATSARSRRLALAVLCAAQLMIILDQNIVTVALPAIQQDLGFTQQNLVWTVNAYVVPFGGVLLLAGRLGDLHLEQRQRGRGDRFGVRGVPRAVVGAAIPLGGANPAALRQVPFPEGGCPTEASTRRASSPWTRSARRWRAR